MLIFAHKAAQPLQDGNHEHAIKTDCVALYSSVPESEAFVAQPEQIDGVLERCKG